MVADSAEERILSPREFREKCEDLRLYGAGDETGDPRAKDKLAMSHEALRSRLEEVEEERERLKRKVNKWIFRRSAARRRADRLEGAVRLVLKWFNRFGYEEGGPKMDSQDVIGALRSALDHGSEGEKGRSLDLEYARTNEMVDESVTMGAPSPMPLGYMVMSSIPDDCRGCTWETLSGTGRVEKWILKERDPDCPVHTDEPEGDDCTCVTEPDDCPVHGSLWERFSVDPPTDEPVSREGEESTVKALWSFASDHVPCDGDVSIHVVEIDGDPYFALRCDPCNAVLKVRNEADYPVDFPPTPVSEVSPHLRPTDPTTHADARSKPTVGEIMADFINEDWLKDTIFDAMADAEPEAGGRGAKTPEEIAEAVWIGIENEISYRLSDRHAPAPN